ncbi:MAG: HAMP domain-containing protein [Acetobacteraceae bacterium]|jgi:methyl-accepting chemotaxis protein
MNLRTLFAIPIAVILIVTLSLAGMVAGQGWSGMIRGKVAIETVERMRLLLALQTELRAERVVTNFVLGKPYPLAEAVRRRFDTTRRETDQALRAVVAELHAEAQGGANEARPDQYLGVVDDKLNAVRHVIDGLLARDLSERTLVELDTVMPRMIAVSQPVDAPLERAHLAVTAADESLSGLLTEDRLAESLRDQVALIAAILLPRFDKAEQPSAAELDRVRILLARAAYLTRLLNDTIEIAGATIEIRRSLADLGTIDVTGILGRLEAQASEPLNRVDDSGVLLPQQLLIPWGERINQLRAALMDATVARVTSRQTTHERQFDLMMTGFGVVMVAVLESVVLLSQRVVGPLAQLGLAITRIAAGDRSTALNLHSGTREINEMVTAVETLREAALVADATALRHRLAARQRLEMLREALGIARTVEGPARALERGVASLSEGIDATIALITTPTSAPPATLCLAATAVRAGLAEMRDSAAELDATFAAAAETEDRPEAEFVAHILAVRAQVDRREAAVRGFVLPSLVALRDAAATAGAASGPALRDLVSDQFARVEETVAVISSMLATITRASAIVRDLPLDEDAPMAA